MIVSKRMPCAVVTAAVALMVGVSFVHGDDGDRCSERWSADRANTWYADRPWLVGFNYVPSSACNTTEWWQAESFDPVTIDRELGWAEELGFNSIRCFIQYLVWKSDPDGLKQRFDRFLKIAADHGLNVMPVLFDDCAFGDPVQMDPFLGKQRDPVPGMILPSWTPSPGRKLGLDPKELPQLKEYVADMIGRFRSDHRIVIWDLFNEPMNVAQVGKPELVRTIFQWAREVGPTQPLTVSVWNGNGDLNKVLLAESDVISFHKYGPHQHLIAAIRDSKRHRRPVVCTEWMARPTGSNIKNDLPVFQKERVGCYMWGFVSGRTQCQFPWWNKPNGPVADAGWFHDILQTDGTPYREAEVEFIRAMLKHNIRRKDG